MKFKCLSNNHYRLTDRSIMNKKCYKLKSDIIFEKKEKGILWGICIQTDQPIEMCSDLCLRFHYQNVSTNTHSGFL